MKVVIWSIIFYLAQIAQVVAQSHPYIQQAETLYEKEEYSSAIQYLLSVPGILHLSPALTPQNEENRARLFYDLGCCYFALGDSTLADQAFKEAFALDDKLTQGNFNNADSGTLWWALLRNKEASRRMKTTRMSATMKSLLVPGWGQFYRGHKKKGYAFLGATILASGITALQFKSYQEARDEYKDIDVQLSLKNVYTNNDGTLHSEWTNRHRNVKSAAKRVNVALGFLALAWVVNIADSAIFEPAPMGIYIHF